MLTKQPSASRGKYARVSLEIVLTKSLLAKFRLKNRIYRIEYEGLHNVVLIMESTVTTKTSAQAR